jgi:cell division protein FtsL
MENNKYYRECKVCCYVCDDKKKWFNHRNSKKHKDKVEEAETYNYKQQIEQHTQQIEQQKQQLEEQKQEIEEQKREIYKLKCDLELASFKFNYIQDCSLNSYTQNRDISNNNVYTQSNTLCRDIIPQVQDKALNLYDIDLFLNDMISWENTPNEEFQKELLSLSKEERPVKIHNKILYVKNDGVWVKEEDAVNVLNKYAKHLFANLNKELTDSNNCESEVEQVNYLKAQQLIFTAFNAETIVRGIKQKI